jgi:hypothetical protein
LALALGAWTAPSHAARSSVGFDIAVTPVLAADGGTGFCRSSAGTGAFGATVTVACNTGTVTDIEATGRRSWLPTHGGAYRYLIRVTSYDLLATIDSYVGAGTSTAFRVVSLAGREYVEMTVGW